LKEYVAMTARHKVTSAAALGVAPFALLGVVAGPAVAHGSMTDPVSRVSACFAEGPESPDSAACKAAVAASGTQAFYDWNEVNIANAAGNHQRLIPDGKLCSAGRDKYKGLDLARGDWPSSPFSSGNRTFRYKATAPHKGSFELYLTKDGYDPTKPLKWSDLEAKPFAKVNNPKLENGAYVFNGVVPNKSGRHLIYSIWQRSDSPEAFYTCSDVVFGKDNGTAGGGTAGGGTAPAPAASAAPAPVASAPSEEQIKDSADKSTVDHAGHGGDDDTKEILKETATEATPEAAPAAENTPAAADVNLAETGGDSNTPYIAIGGAVALALGGAAMFGTVRRRA
jgi:chitin-binding protein